MVKLKVNHTAKLILPIKKQWFDMILSGIKKEEYREIKPYWTTRFAKYFGIVSREGNIIKWRQEQKEIVFKNGYGKDAPQFTALCTISEGTGNIQWGAVEREKYYVLKIHKVYNLINCKTANPAL